jgi:hypothetical protein
VTDERDLRDSRVDAAWRGHMREAPPPPLDAAILAAAHRAVQSGPRSTDGAHRPRHRAWVPLAIAATLGVIAFGVVQLAPHETDTLSSSVSDAPFVARKLEPAAAAKPEPPRVEESRDGGVVVAPRAPEPAQRPPEPAQRPPEPAQRAAEPASRGTEDRQQRREQAAGQTARDARVAPQSAPVPGVASRKDSAAAAPSTPPRDAQPTREREAFPAAPPIESKTLPEVALAPPPASAPPPPPLAAGALESSPAPARAPAPAPAPPPAAPGAAATRGLDATTALQKQAFADKRTSNAAPSSLDSAAAPRDAPVARVGAASRAESARAKVATTRTPDDFVQEIRRLRGEGRDADAGLALAAFRAAYDDADARLPDDLRAWARTVARP